MLEQEKPELVSDPPRSAHFILRCTPADARSLLASLTTSPPLQVGECANASEGFIYCIGPDEWQISAPLENAATIASSLENRAAAICYSLVEVSDARVAFEILGPRADEILNSGCPLDLSIEAFPAGRAVRTLFYSASVIIHRVELQRFRMTTLRSFQPYVRELLCLATEELEAEAALGCLVI